MLNPSRNLFVGDRVEVMIDGLEPLRAEVRWHDRGERAGLCFSAPVEDEPLGLLVAHCGARAKVVQQELQGCHGRIRPMIQARVGHEQESAR